MRRRPTTAAALAVVVLVVGQLAALSHEADSRHVTCPEHGEQLEAVELAQQHRCSDSHWVAVDGDGGEHADCAIVHALHQAGVAPAIQLLATLTEPVAFVATVTSTPATSQTALYRIAPKTSPPRA